MGRWLGWASLAAITVMVVSAPSTAFADSEPLPLPEGFYASTGVRPLVDALWQRSPGFRSQVRRIVEADVRVFLEVVSPAALGNAGAKSIMVREHGAVRYVRVQLRAASDWTPLIPHELEHVLEAIEGIDLSKLASRSTGAWETGRGMFESARAQQAGHRIALEYHRGMGALNARLEPVK